MIRYTIISADDMVGSGGEINETITSGDTYILTGLSLLVNYSVQVAATTINGTGPFSTSVIVMPIYGGKCEKKHPRVCHNNYHVNYILYCK